MAGAEFGGAGEVLDTRALCLIRETLARHSGLADFAFAMQGLGSGAISLDGTPQQKQRYLPLVARGEAIAAFALSEPDAGSDVAALALDARVDGEHVVLNGEKTWISNGGIADFYVVFARSGEAPGSRGISAFIVDAGTPGFEIAERINVIAPHPLARLKFSNCRVPLSRRIGEAGQGFKVAMRTLDVFRTSVAAAALGFARRALAEALQRATTRRMFGGVLADFQLTQAKLAQMATTIDSAALLTYRSGKSARGSSITMRSVCGPSARTATMCWLQESQSCSGRPTQRWKCWRTASAVTGEPSWKRAFLRSSSTHSLPSASKRQLCASAGAMRPRSSRFTSVS